MRVSPQQAAIIRTRPQSTKLYLSIFEPQIIFQARINNTGSAVGDRLITYDNASGSFNVIKDGQTMWVGTTPGAMDIGKIRVRSATSSVITVSENSNIDWQDNLYLTVFKYWELWPIFPRIIIDPANQENVIFYKDYDIPYTNQNAVLGTYVNAGPHRAAMRDPASGLARIYYTSTGSYNMLGSTLHYSWEFSGGSPNISTLATPGYINYGVAGHFVTRLYISGSNGEIDTTYRYVSIYDDNNLPIQKWELQGPQGSRDEGGYNTSFKVFETIPIQEHAVVVVFQENQYGDTQVNIGGNAENNSSIFFVGYVDKDSIQYDYEHSEVSFDAHSITAMMKESAGFSVSVQSVLAPDTWYELKDMDGRRALYHYLRWHTTALFISDFQFMGDDYKIQYFDSDRESMYDALNNYMQNTLRGKVVSDRQSKVWMEVDAQAYTNPTGSFPVVMNITNRDWVNSPTIEEQLSESISYIEYGGVAYSGAITGTFAPYVGSAPGQAPGFHGTIDNHEGLALLSQQQLNQLVGNVFANKNAPFPTIGIDMSINAQNLDIAPQETVGVSVLKTDTVRNLAIQGLYIPTSMNWKYDSNGFLLLPTIENMTQLVSGRVGETVVIPPIEDVGGGFELPRIEIPPIDTTFPRTHPDIGDGAPPRVILHDQVAGLIYTNTFNLPNTQVAWFQSNGGLTLAQYQLINKIVVCPSGAIYVGYVVGPATPSTDGFLARASYLGGPYTVIIDYDDMTALYGGSTDNVGLCAFECDRTQGERLLFAVTEGGENVKTFLGAGSTFTAKTDITQNTNNGSDISYGGIPGRWIFTASGKGYVLSQDASSIIDSEDVGVNTASRHARPSALLGDTIHWNDDDLSATSLAISRGTNNLATVQRNISQNLDSLYQYIDGIVCDATGLYLMARDNNTLPIKSSDGGYSWSSMINLSPLILWYYANPGDAGRWIAARGAPYYSDNFGITWRMKWGNIHDIVPLPFIDAIKVVP